ncbi:MAG TPA: sigma-54 dependent transcriptional regulator [Candidatus Eisenbacteria bacterium]|jgi:DNA-binding NtrC family response regulator
MSRILAVDDDPDAVRCVAGVLERDHEVVACTAGDAALRELALRRFDLVITDLGMPPPDGFEVLSAAQRLSPPAPVLVLSALDAARPTLRALRLGARDYLLKPAGPDEVRAAVLRVLTDSADAEACDYGLMGRSPGIRQVRQMVPLLAQRPETVLILGETGTGKELLARAIHEHGPRRAGPFVAHNMAATPSDLAESLFFGHVRGAFSGAATDHTGLFEQAHGGTLFLDEADSFPLPLQAKLLRALESGTLQRVGSAAERAVEVRVLAASAVNLEELVERGAFRADLYYRLRQLEVTLPTLRERAGDVPLLARHFLEEMAGQIGCVPQLSEEAQERLLSHAWPGNVRELRNAVRSAALFAGSGPILPGHLPRALQHPADPGTAGPLALRDAERDLILRTLERAGGNRSLAARLLGIDRGTLARKLKALAEATRRPMV